MTCSRSVVFPADTTISFINKTDRHNIAVALNNKTHSSNENNYIIKWSLKVRCKANIFNYKTILIVPYFYLNVLGWFAFKLSLQSTSGVTDVIFCGSKIASVSEIANDGACVDMSFHLDTPLSYGYSLILSI